MTLCRSQYTRVNSCCKPKLPTKALNQIASFTASMVTMYHVFVTTMYSTLMVDKAIVDCKVAFQLITLPHKMNTYPIKDLLLSKSPT